MIAFILTLIIIGQILLFIELAIIPGLGLAGIFGLGTIITSCYLSFSKISTTAGIAVIIVNIILAIIITALTLRNNTWKRFSLKTNINAKTDTAAKDKGIEIGAKGQTITRLAPQGTALINGITLEVACRGCIIDSQKEIEVIQIQDNKVYVKEIAQ